MTKSYFDLLLPIATLLVTWVEAARRNLYRKLPLLSPPPPPLMSPPS